MAEQTPMPDAWVGQEATVTYLAGTDIKYAFCIVREVTSPGVGVEEVGQKTSFFPWSSIVRIDRGDTRFGSRRR
jgi:hypothetical protein